MQLTQSASNTEPPSALRSTPESTAAQPREHDYPDLPRGKQKHCREAFEWHIRMNHTALRKLATMAKHHNVGLPSTLKSTPIHMDCSGYAVGSFQPAPHQCNMNRPIPGHAIVCDIAGPLKKTRAGYKYFLSIIELHTRYALVFF